ncbi:MAG: magnesium transporter [Gammaproteobacteria bacterium]|nr:magnesium transporter [Gammaproteobacteria bacterium]
MTNHLMPVNSLSLHYLQNHPQDAARALEQFEPEDLANYLEMIPAESTADIFRHMIPSRTVSCLINMNADKASGILEQFSIERATSLLRRMNMDIRKEVIMAMSPVFANMMRVVLKYPNGTVGQFMNPNVFAVREDMYTDDVLNAVRDSSDQVRSEIYVINGRQQLVGVVFIRDLLTEGPRTPVKNIMQNPEVTIAARSSLASVQDHPEWKYKEILPVVDHMGMFIGVLKRGVMLDVLTNIEDGAQQQDEFTNTALAMVELFWDTCSDLLALEEVTAKKRK